VPIISSGEYSLNKEMYWLHFQESTDVKKNCMGKFAKGAEYHTSNAED
jgi:hypothetical protein